MAKTRERTPSAVSRVVGRQVRAVREQLRLSQDDLAQRLRQLDVRIDQATIARLETGPRRISVDDALALAAALGVAPAFLLSGSFTSEAVPVTPALEAGPLRMRHWINGVMPLVGTDEESFFELVPAAERIARQRSGLLNLERCVFDFKDAATTNDSGGMLDALKDLARELERQRDQIDREERQAKRGASRG
jgi:transcriptional regulator with XRE-family HTH domain